MGKYGTNLEGFGAFEGGVNADKGAPLVSTSSDGETALLFGPAALREIQAGVANGDFAIPPDEADATITAENPLPYWTFTDVNSNGAITCAIVNDTAYASTNIIRWSIANATTTGKSAQISRFIPVPSSRDRAFCMFPEVYVSSAFSANARFSVTMSWAKADYSVTGSNRTVTKAIVGTIRFNPPTVVNNCPSDAAYIYIKVTAETTGTTGAITGDIGEVRLNTGKDFLYIAESQTPDTSTVPYLASLSGSLGLLTSGAVISINADSTVNVSASSGATFTGDIGVDGRIYFDSALTGPYIQQAGTNGRIISVANATSTDGVDLLASTTSTRSGILITKSVTGQPTTTLNGTGATDAFADVLRNGGIAVDSTNNRGYFYSGGWKFAALTTPSDSRLKDEITEITDALNTLRQLMPVAFKWRAPDAHGRTDAVADDGKRLGFIADQVATTDLAHWVETLGVDEREAHLVDTTEVLAVNIPQNEIEALVVQALLDIDARLKALESR